MSNSVTFTPNVKTQMDPTSVNVELVLPETDTSATVRFLLLSVASVHNIYVETTVILVK